MTDKVDAMVSNTAGPQVDVETVNSCAGKAVRNSLHKDKKADP